MARMKRIKAGALPWFLFSVLFLLCWYLLERKVLHLSWLVVIGAGIASTGMGLANTFLFAYDETIRRKNIVWGVMGIVWVGSLYLRLAVWHVAPESAKLYIFCGAICLAYASFIRIQRKQQATLV
jgi:uncharacterized BrkB/YihY/UPF0761 family membrane protein